MGYHFVGGKIMLFGWIFLAGLLAFVLGVPWYTVLFGEIWVRATGMTDDKIKASNNGKPLWLNYLITFMIEIIVAGIIAFFYQYFAITGLSSMLLAGTLLGCFASISSIKNYLYEEKPLALLFVNEGYKFLIPIVISLLYAFVLK